jgi:hypothetical protein
MRVLYLLMFGAILSACNTFNVVPGYSPYVSLNPPTIQHWQKPNTIGRTNVDKRWQDAQECGVKNYVNGTLDLSVSYPGMTTEQVKQRSKSISTCMENKGYIYLKNTECVDGKNNKLTGLCN